MGRILSASTLALFCLVSCTSAEPDGAGPRGKTLALGDHVSITVPSTMKVLKDTVVIDYRQITLETGGGRSVYVEYGEHCSPLTEPCIELVRDSAYYYSVIKNASQDIQRQHVFIGYNGNPDKDYYRRSNVAIGRVGHSEFKRLAPVRSTGTGFYGYHFYCVHDESSADRLNCMRLNVYAPAVDSAEYHLVDSISYSLNVR